MSQPIEPIVDGIVNHLEQMKKQGVKRVNVSREALEELSQPIQIKPAALPSSPVRSVDPGKSDGIAKLRERALVCQKCPHLVKSRTQVVFGVGNIDAEVMFVGEAPGADEDAKGEPFVGRAGQLLTKIILAMGFQRSDVYIANILKCRPDMPPGESGNRKPTPDEMDTCKPYLLAQIDLIKPKLMVALGATAVEGLTASKIGITKLRGTWLEFHGVPLMPTYHPSYLLYNQALSERRKVWEDMLKVLEKLGKPISERQQNFFKSAT
ncbi:MAG: uracil-DNA glycosylase [Verrucomicrobiae bacterium]|nr:uracil-DNA glycosylase [Verrucomicrobiae bacterium]